MKLSLRWRHNGRDGVSNHQPHECLLNRLFRRRPKNTSKLRVTGLCAGNSPLAGEFPAQKGSNAENVSIWWRHHDIMMGGRIGPVCLREGEWPARQLFIANSTRAGFVLLWNLLLYITVVRCIRVSNSGVTCSCALPVRLTHWGRVTHYGDSSMLCKSPIFFTIK